MMNAAAAAEMTATEITERLTGTQKSAILMMLLGEEEAAEILKNLSPKEVQHSGGAMYSCAQYGSRNRQMPCLTNFLPSSSDRPALG